MLVLLGVTLAGVTRYRAGQFSGYGLKGRYFANIDFKGTPFRTLVEPVIDFSSEDDEPRFKRPRFSAQWTGSIVLPRTGRYLFATESDDGSWIDIDGDTVVDNGGVHGARRREGVRVLEAGPHAIRVRYFQAGAGGSLRLFWMPCRRGVLESIPPTVLFPRPPDQVRVARAHAIPPRDLPAVAMLTGALLLACLVWGRHGLTRWLRRLRRERWARADLGLCLVLLAAALALRLWDRGAAGQTWDEDVYWTAGRNFIDNLLGLDFRSASWAWNHEHPALAKWLYGPATLIADGFEPARVVAIVVGSLTCVVVFLAGRDMINRRVGFVGAALCVVMPHIIGHSKIIGLETPTGLFYALTAWVMFLGLRQGGNSRFYLLAGLFTGLALATRLSNLSLLLLVLVLYLIAHHKQIRSQRSFPVSITLGLAPLVIVLVFVGIWPYLWDNLMGHVGKMLSFWKPDTYLEFFLGQRQEPPVYYMPLYFLVTTPVALLPLIPVGLVRTMARRDLGHLTLLLWFLAPWIVMFSPMARDGVRYLYPALFAACLLAAAGADWVAVGLGRLLRRPAVAGPVLSILGTAMGLQSLYAGFQVHPYYIDYYNELTGGPKRVAERRLFEIAWWGEGLKDAAAHVSRIAPVGATVKVYVHPTHVVQLRSDLKLTDRLDADFILYNNLFNNPLPWRDHQLAHVVRAAGAPLVWVYRKESGAAP